MAKTRGNPKVRGVVLVGKDSIELQDLPEPGIGSPDHVIVETDALSFCSTDTEVIDGTMAPKKLPIIIGHEASGRVIDKGKNATNVEVGDRVLVDPNLSDLTCPLCVKGLNHLCLNGGLMGRETDGLFAERIALPSRNLYRLPASIPVEISPLIQPLSTVVHAHERIQIHPGDTVLVLGLGVTGLMLAQLAKMRGAYVIVSSTVPWKLELSKRLGVDAVVSRLESDVVSRVMEITRGRGVDVAIDATSYPNLLVRTGVQVLRPGGTVLLFATRSRELNLDAFQAYFRELTFKATRSSQPRDFERAVRLVEQGRVDLNYLITRTFPLEKTVEALSFYKNRASVLKAVITTRPGAG